jgi:hypothetical protein
LRTVTENGDIPRHAFRGSALDLLCQIALELGLTPAHYRKPLLRRTLSLQMHEPLRQRIAVQYQLDGARQPCASTASAFLVKLTTVPANFRVARNPGAIWIKHMYDFSST